MKKSYVEDKDDYSTDKFKKKPGASNSRRKEKPDDDFLDLINLDKLKTAQKLERDRKYKAKKAR